MALSHTEILLTVHSRRIWGSNVTANTIPGFTRNSAPLWARGQDVFLVIYGARVQAHLATSVELCKGSAVLYRLIKVTPCGGWDLAKSHLVLDGTQQSNTLLVVGGSKQSQTLRCAGCSVSSGVTANGGRDTAASHLVVGGMRQSHTLWWVGRNRVTPPFWFHVILVFFHLYFSFTKYSFYIYFPYFLQIFLAYFFNS